MILHFLRGGCGRLSRYNRQPLLNKRSFGKHEIADAYDAVAKGSKGKVVIEF